MVDDSVVISLLLLGRLPRLGSTSPHDEVKLLGCGEGGEHGAERPLDVAEHGVEHGAEHEAGDAGVFEGADRMQDTLSTTEAREVSG